MKMIKLGLAICILVLSFTVARAEPKLIDIPYKDKEPNITLTVTAKDSRAVVIYLKGGHGLFRWSSNRTYTDFPADRAVLDLHQKNISVVAPDWPYSMKIEKGGSNMICGKRCSKESQERLLNVLDYTLKTFPNQPIWIVGHSNGTTSIQYFTKFLKDLNRLFDIRGVVMSGSRSEVRIKLSELRVAMLHHKNDNCQYTNPSVAESVFNTNKKWLKDNISIEWVEGGHNGGYWDKKGPCIAGKHSYEGAEGEATGRFRNIILGGQ